MLRLCLFVFYLLACLGCGAAERAALVLSQQEYPPYIGAHLPYQGIMSRLVATAFAQAGIKVRFEPTNNNRAIEGARRGLYDGSYGWARSPEREADLYFSEPVVNLRMVFCRRRDRAIAWMHLTDLVPFSLGLTRGNFYGDDLMLLVRDGRLRADFANSDIDNLKKLVNSRIDLLPIDVEVGPYLIHTQLDSASRGLLHCPDHAFWHAPLHVVLSRKLLDGAQLVERFNRAWRDMRRRGDIERLSDEARQAIYRGAAP